jgi:putative ABC transport system permease protein
MTALLHIAARSAWNRRGTLGLVMLSIALATALLLGLERLRSDIRSSFSQAVSGTDLVVGPRSGAVQLMLRAVFHIGGASGGEQGMKMDSLRAIAAHRAVAWVVPISLGDSHRGRPVLGTTPAFFERYAYGNRQPLAFAQGRAFAGDLNGLYEAVVGAEVAAALGYRLGQRITLAHGLEDPDDPDHDHDKKSDPNPDSKKDSALALPGLPSAKHSDKPFIIVGVLAPTGTPVDRAVHVSLEAIEALHLDWAGGAPLPGANIAPELARKFDLQPKQISAALVGLKGRAAVFNVQRFVGDFAGEPLMAVLPGVALDELWTAVGLGERALFAVSALVALVSLASLVAVVLAGLNERRRELAVLRAVGAGPRQVLVLLAAEGLWVTLGGALLGAVLAALSMWLAAPWVQQQLGIGLQLGAPSTTQWALWAAVLLAGMLASLVPGWRAYRLSLADGLSPRT